MTERDPKERLQRAAVGVRRQRGVGDPMAPEQAARAFVSTARRRSVRGARLYLSREGRITRNLSGTAGDLSFVSFVGTGGFFVFFWGPRRKPFFVFYIASSRNIRHLYRQHKS